MRQADDLFEIRVNLVIAEDQLAAVFPFSFRANPV